MYDRKLPTTLGKVARDRLREAYPSLPRWSKNAVALYMDALNTYNKRVETIKKDRKRITNKVAFSELPLYDNQDDVLKLRKQHEREQQQKLKKQREEEKKQTEKLMKNVIVLDIKKISLLGGDYDTGGIIPSLRKELSKLIGKSVNVVYKPVGGEIIEYTYDIPTRFTPWWNNALFDWRIDTATTVFKENNYTGKLFIYPEHKLLKQKKVIQYFAEGVTHCMFTPIIKEVVRRANDAKSKPTKHRYEKIANDCRELIETYKDGVPENLLGDIANKLQINIKIRLPLCNKYLEGRSDKKALCEFVFTNTRLNHVELNEVTTDNKYTDVEGDVLRELLDKLNKNGLFYEYKMSGGEISSIKTIEGNYRVTNRLRKTITDFEIETGLSNCKLDDITERNVSQFIRSGVHYNATVDFIEKSKLFLATNTSGDVTEAMYNNNRINHIDMQKAYANFHTCKWYDGFVGKLTDFRVCDKIVAVGYYKVEKFTLVGKLMEINNKLKIYVDGGVYPSCELQMLEQLGCSFTISCGAWGSKIDFRFTDEMINGKHNGSAYYALCCGIWNSHRENELFWFRGCEEHFSAIEAQCEGILKRFGDDRMALFVKKEHNYHLSHVTGFITAYQRMNVIEQLMGMDLNKIVRICVDGIYSYEKHISLKNVFRYKPDYNFGNDAGIGYISVYSGEYSPSTIEKEHHMKQLFLGAGGCGKTHNVLVGDYVRLCYYAPSWKLARAKHYEYGVVTSVWERLITTDPAKISINKRFNVLLIDEVSMMTEGQKRFILDTYSECKIIFCGDIGNQLPPIENDAMDTSGFDSIVTLNVNHRCRDTRLLHILNTLRHMHQSATRHEILNYCVSSFGVMPKESICYDVNDMILASTNKIKDWYSEKYSAIGKYRVTATNSKYCNGDIVIGEKPSAPCSLQHAFTVHSIQGETATGKLFIDIRSVDIFDKTLLYTAISRAREYSQICLIH